jgi:formylglycine-generating enzyme required for sulfatase activity
MVILKTSEWHRAIPKLVAVFLHLPLACSSEPEERPQVLLFVHTNAPIVGELAEHAEFSHDLAINKLRVDALDENLRVYDVKEFLANDAESWPLSFGVTPPRSGHSVLLRVRAYRAARSSPEATVAGKSENPWEETAIDRVISLRIDGKGGVSERSIVLDAACVGTPASFFGTPSTCIDREHLEAPADTGIAEGRIPRPEKSDLAFEQPCHGEAGPDRVCIPGGYSVLGDPDLQGLEDELLLAAFPLRPVVVPPFFMDRKELTVGRFRELVSRRKYLGSPPGHTDGLNPYCSYHGPDDASYDELALTCVTFAEAQAICVSAGGSLPTEARWEHAARGRGEARTYPWGDEQPTCCRASLWRTTPINVGGCEGSGPEPVASHASCASGGDSSRDGALDLGGGIAELVVGAAQDYDEPCWEHDGIARDPRCDPDGTTLTVARGGNWSSGLATALAALRHDATIGHTTGFRCVYEDVP